MGQSVSAKPAAMRSGLWARFWKRTRSLSSVRVRVAELGAEDAEAARRIAEAGGGLGGGQAVDEVGSEGFVLALGGVSGFEEESSVGCYLILCIYGNITTISRIRETSTPKRQLRANSAQNERILRGWPHVSGKEPNNDNVGQNQKYQKPLTINPSATADFRNDRGKCVRLTHMHGNPG